jgi:hypothetical protein
MSPLDTLLSHLCHGPYVVKRRGGKRCRNIHVSRYAAKSPAGQDERGHRTKQTTEDGTTDIAPCACLTHAVAASVPLLLR